MSTIDTQKKGASVPFRSHDNSKAAATAHKVNRHHRDLENITPPPPPPAEAAAVAGAKKRKKRKFVGPSLTIQPENNNTSMPVAKKAGSPAEMREFRPFDAPSSVKHREALISELAKMKQAAIPRPPQLISMNPLKKVIVGAKSGQGALVAEWIDPQTRQHRHSKCKTFNLNTCGDDLPVRDPALRGCVTAPFTGYLCPETVIPSTVVKASEWMLITMQDMHHGSMDLHRHYKQWESSPGNEGDTVIDYLESLFEDKPDLEEEFIVASLSEIVIGSIDSKAPNMLFDPKSGTFKLCDTDISLRDIPFAHEGILTAETGKIVTYLCERKNSDAQRLAFMGQSLQELADKYPKVSAFLNKADRADKAKTDYLANPANKALVGTSLGLAAIVDEGTSLVTKRVGYLRDLAKSGGSLNDLLESAK